MANQDGLSRPALRVHAHSLVAMRVALRDDTFPAACDVSCRVGLTHIASSAWVLGTLSWCRLNFVRPSVASSTGTPMVCRTLAST